MPDWNSTDAKRDDHAPYPSATARGGRLRQEPDAHEIGTPAD